MKRALQIVALLYLLFSLTSCATTNLKTYYFPISEDSETLVYKYVNPQDSSLSEYWEVISDPYENSLITNSYNADFTIYNSFEEEFTEEGAKLTSYIDYEKTNEGEIKEIKAETITDDVFLWDSKNSYSFSLKYVNKYGRFDLMKKRKDLGFEEVEINDEKYKTVKFVDQYYVHAIDQEDKYIFQQVSYYAANMGMVKYERFIPNSGPQVLELVEIMTKREFELEKARYKNHAATLASGE